MSPVSKSGIRYLLLFSALVQIAFCDYANYIRLFDDVIRPHDHRFPPQANNSKALEVSVIFHLHTLIDIVDVSQEAKMSAWLNFTWYDEIRTWDPLDYGGIDLIHPDPLDVWRPRVIIINSLTERDMFQDKHSPLILSSDGRSSWIPSAVLSLSCDLDMTYFPFDQQECHVTILSMYPNQSVVMTTEQGFNTQVEQMSNGEWKIVSYEVRTGTTRTGGDEFSMFVVSLLFERKSLFYIINTLCPVMFLSFLTFLGFLIPEDRGDRSSFAVTVLLALAVFMTIVSGLIPHISDTFPIVVYYILWLLLISGLSVVTIVIQLAWQRKKEEADNRIAIKSFLHKLHGFSSQPNEMDEHKATSVTAPTITSVIPLNKDLTPNRNDIASELFRKSKVSNESHVGLGSAKKCNQVSPENQAFKVVQNSTTHASPLRYASQFLHWLVMRGNILGFICFALIWIIITTIYMTQLTASST